MALVPAECSACGGLVKVDNEERLAICQYCGKPFVVEEAIQTFNNYYNNIYHITNNTSHNYGDGTVVNVYEDTGKDFVVEGGVLKKYQGESLTPVVPEGVIAIEGGVFANSAITKVTLPSTLKELRSANGNEGPFSDCNYLEEINLPEGLKLIGAYCFRHCKCITSIIIPNSVESIGREAFWGCTSITSITVSENVTYVGGSAFYGCTNLEKVFWDAKKILDFRYSESPFRNAGTSNSGFELIFGNNVEKIPASCCRKYVDNINIKKVTIGSKVTHIGEYAFYGCTNLTSITIPDSVTSIGESAFDGCSNLTSIRISDNVTHIGNYAFRGCTNLKNINGSIDFIRTHFPGVFKEINRKKGLCQYCGGTFKEGFFSIKCSKCGRTKDY